MTPIAISVLVAGLDQARMPCGTRLAGDLT
jgi:hypothetical protein